MWFLDLYLSRWGMWRKLRKVEWEYVDSSDEVSGWGFRTLGYWRIKV